ncbi:hypothetical protein PC129_g14765 [Phytophthora cactorum]|uniref:Uncharacterized protein n=1 Tax=Phytophthora cactorum TaxID=29920 RepID=A0A8T1FN54_9STRA|nr:hypothetical protein PC111_g15260 [Phytophthora cactorum]KAG2821678.1 hypothetical protein PC112_g11260 [Phytophthora cactorum]KAG2852309.1 hypothetical protein PC113_g15142 [Phytophthora cactorum]KAG2889465.1 hypothetical protein PC114_g17934 [Phytophthora cactorum]KAG2901782.1 hypothetical protein PC115_g15774 [Phytophthora cactorum]
MEGVTRLVEAAIGDELLDEFGLMLDGWSDASEHYVAVFAWYEPDGVAKTGLLSMAPIINEPEEDLSARTHRDVLAGMLEHDFRKQASRDHDASSIGRLRKPSS